MPIDRHRAFAKVSDERLSAELMQLSAGWEPRIVWKPVEIPGEEAEPEIMDPQQRLALWKSRFGSASPIEVLASLSTGYIRKLTRRMVMRLSDDGVFEGDPCSIILEYHDHEKGLKGQFNLQVMEPLGEGREAYLADAHVDSLTGAGEGRGTGMGGAILLNIVNTLRRFKETDRLLVHAENVGSYAWAKMGFEPTPEAWREGIKPALKARFASVKDQLAGDPHFQEKLHRAILQGDPLQVRQILKARKEGFDPEHPARPLSLEKFLLRNLSWSGAFNLRDPESYNMLVSHVSGQRVIARG